MAAIKKHGKILVIEKLFYSVCYCKDGHILRNDGRGWKLWKKIKSGLNPYEIALKHEREYQEKIKNNPWFAHWRSLVHQFDKSLRPFLVKTVEIMPNDPDGVWAELTDCLWTPAEKPSLQECIDLCNAFKASINEQKEKVPKAEPTKIEAEPANP